MSNPNLALFRTGQDRSNRIGKTSLTRQTEMVRGADGAAKSQSTVAGTTMQVWQSISRKPVT